MILPLFRRNQRATSIAALYGAIVAQARLPAFYRDYGVPDTVEGRLDLIILHVVLLLHRFADEPADLKALGQAVFDRFCLDMDDNLREMGIGDLAVPRQMGRIAEAFYGRAKAYEAALAASGNEGLAAALRRNIFGDDAASSEPAAHLAVYVRAVVSDLHGQGGAAFAAGRLSFPAPLAEAEMVARGA